MTSTIAADMTPYMYEYTNCREEERDKREAAKESYPSSRGTKEEERKR